MIGRRGFILLALCFCISLAFTDKELPFSLVGDLEQKKLMTALSLGLSQSNDFLLNLLLENHPIKIPPACLWENKAFKELEEAGKSPPEVAGRTVSDLFLKQGMSFPWKFPEHEMHRPQAAESVEPRTMHRPQAAESVKPRTRQVGKRDSTRIEEWVHSLPSPKRQGQRLSVNGALASLANMVDSENRRNRQYAIRDRLLSIGKRAGSAPIF